MLDRIAQSLVLAAAKESDANHAGVLGTILSQVHNNFCQVQFSTDSEQISTARQLHAAGVDVPVTLIMDYSCYEKMIVNGQFISEVIASGIASTDFRKEVDARDVPSALSGPTPAGVVGYQPAADSGEKDCPSLGTCPTPKECDSSGTCLEQQDTEEASDQFGDGVENDTNEELILITDDDVLEADELPALLEVTDSDDDDEEDDWLFDDDDDDELPPAGAEGAIDVDALPEVPAGN